jgi:ABC-type nitrate/sulfonate/bicarbonate transport system substrate-binding protein
MNFARAFTFSIALALSASGSACSGTKSANNLPKLRVGTVPWAGWSALDVAKSKGIFEEEGLRRKPH